MHPRDLDQYEVSPLEAISTERTLETREEATARFHKYWKDVRPTSFLEAFLAGARVR